MAEKRVSKLDRVEDLVFVNTRETSYKWGGYKKELVTQNLTALEEHLFVCSVCRGIMYETCSIRGGLAQVCESCVGEEGSYQPIASIRSTISKLVCKCALSERGCDWEGTLGGLAEHMEECSEFIVQCLYIKYGCKKECKRGELENHRKEAKEYHTEVVSVFMADKVDSLEKEKKEQVIRIDQQAVRIDQQAAKIQEFEAIVKEFSYLKDYFKLNGIVWTITNRDGIINRIHRLRSEPQTATGKLHDNTVHGGDANYSQWNGTTAQGPRFVVHTFYHLYPTLTVQTVPIANLNLQVLPQQYDQEDEGVCRSKKRYNQHNNQICYMNNIIWPLTGKCEVILVNQTNPEKSWKFTKDNFQVQNEGIVNITNIPFDVLLDEKYNKDNTLVLKILIDPFRP